MNDLSNRQRTTDHGQLTSVENSLVYYTKLTVTLRLGAVCPSSLLAGSGRAIQLTPDQEQGSNSVQVDGYAQLSEEKYDLIESGAEGVVKVLEQKNCFSIANKLYLEHDG